MQALIVTSRPERVVRWFTRNSIGVWPVCDAEGTYQHEKKAVLLAIVTREEYSDFKHFMAKADPSAFVSIAEDVRVMGRFVDMD